jgi:hypothetical protein
MIVGTAVDLKFGDRTDAYTDPERRKPPEVSFKAGERIVHVVRAIDATFDQQASGPDDLRVLGDERSLLRRRGSVERRDQDNAKNDTDAAAASCPR